MSLQLDPRTTALVVIDLQQGIATNATEPHTGDQVTARANDLARAVRSGGGLVVLVRVGWEPDLADRLDAPADSPSVLPPGGLPKNWMDFHPGLDVRPGDLLVQKRQWGALYGTDLELQLRRRGIATAVMCGISTNFGVESTARELWERGFHLVFAEDAMSSAAEAMHRFPIERVFPRIGKVRSTGEIVASLEV